MTTFRHPTPETTAAPGRFSLAGILDLLTDKRLPVRFSAYDGSTTGPPDAEIKVHVATPRGVTYLATAPGDLGMARAYIAGDMQAEPALPPPPDGGTGRDHPRAGLGAVAAGATAPAGGPAAVAPDGGGAGALPAS